IIPNDWNEALPVKGATILGNMYANWFGSSTGVASWLQQNLDRLSAETHLFHDSWYKNTTLPYWLVQRILMPVSTLATETCQWWASDKFWAWEGVGSCVGTCTHVWNYEQALARLFPGLERNIREKTDFGTSFQQDGSVLARNGWGDVLIDGHAGAILKAYRESLCSDNLLFLTRNWDKIKRATEYLISQDENDDGLIEKTQANTYDIAFYGANTYVGGLYLAALKAAAKMADLMHDEVFSNRCTTIFNRGMQNSMNKLWNGEYFIQDVDLGKHPKYQYGKGCLSDQLFGQTWSHLVGLGYIYPEKAVKSALESIWKYNWAPDVGVQNRQHPPERVYADPGEAGLLVCTWPHSTHMGEDGVRYRDEVWTGIEYQVATNMIYENMIPEGLSLMKAVHDRYRADKHNPWNEVECGDHYARAMASYGVLVALEDYQFDGPGKSIGFRPKVQQDHFRGFFTSAEGWGSLSQERKPSGQTNSLILSYGKLNLKSFETDLTQKPKRVSLKLGNAPLPCTFSFQDNHLLVAFNELSLAANQRLDIVAEY
ncbi:MAG: GH116 family glycosyl hydrolase, partial [Bacteroidota bacterium]|nr:GH116 family glycosyl hydrolase [Bacteroidota bacterium]